MGIFSEAAKDLVNSDYKGYSMNRHKKQYYKLDDMGFIGTQDTHVDAADISKTVEMIK